jgi:hypothetical protein
MMAPFNREELTMNKPLSPAAGSGLRQRFIEDMTVRGFSEKTRRYYVRIVAGFAACESAPKWGSDSKLVRPPPPSGKSLTGLGNSEVLAARTVRSPMNRPWHRIVGQIQWTTCGPRVPCAPTLRQSQFSTPIDNVVKVRTGDLVSGGRIRMRAIVVQQKTGQPCSSSWATGSAARAQPAVSD